MKTSDAQSFLSIFPRFLKCFTEAANFINLSKNKFFHFFAIFAISIIFAIDIWTSELICLNNISYFFFVMEQLLLFFYYWNFSSSQFQFISILLPSDVNLTEFWSQIKSLGEGKLYKLLLWRKFSQRTKITFYHRREGKVDDCAVVSWIHEYCLLNIFNQQSHGG